MMAIVKFPALLDRPLRLTTILAFLNFKCFCIVTSMLMVFRGTFKTARTPSLTNAEFSCKRN